MLAALEKLWLEAFERFCPASTLMHFAKKARHDTATWMQQRLNLSLDQREKNAKLVKFFDSQLTQLFMLH